MRRCFAILLCLAAPFLGHAGSLADIEIFDRTLGRPLPVYEHQGNLYVAGEPGHQYEVRIRNRSRQRLLAVTSVDGINVISGETAATKQRGYVLDPWAAVDVDGWRKSLDEVATFYFTRLTDSYAARTGRPDDVGVIGVALFREQTQRPACCIYPHEQRADAPAAQAPATADTESSRRERGEDKLGTGHGRRQDSPAQYVDFRRASSSPDETIAIYYDSRRNLVVQGVLPPQPRLVKTAPHPFPAGFVPDPDFN